jgi:hypothetical protein
MGVDFRKPVSFINILEPFTLALSTALVALRDEAEFHDNGDQAVLNAANVFCSLLEDAHGEASGLVGRLERRVAGMDGV